MITIIDYGLGNLGSLANIFKKLGVEAAVSSDISVIEKSSGIVLPGVGSFDAGMENIKKLGLVQTLERKVLEEKTPILGICLGMQLFAQKSEEGILEGLGWIKGEVKKFDFQDDSLKVPHMGWNTIEIKKQDSFLRELPESSRFYFVHSYHFVCKNNDNVLATTNYGYDFPSIIRQGNIFGVQFHPEKSHKFGMQLLKNFAELC